MIIGCLNETSSTENRVTITPSTALKLKNLGFEIVIEKNAGLLSGFSDEEYINADATILTDSNKIIKQSDVIFCIHSLKKQQLLNIKPHSFIIGNLKDIINLNLLNQLKKKSINCLALEKLPRLSRAQPFDILSSQNNLSGYRAAIEAFVLSQKVVPMMITSAGTISPLKFLIIGTGVAGLQAIATAKRLGAKVYANDPRPEAKEQILSLGAIYLDNFISSIAQFDIIITSAFTPSKRAPIIINQKILKNLHPYHILIDMASAFGGNIHGSVDNQLIKTPNGIIYGNSNFASKVPHSASTLLSNNFYNFMSYIYSTDKKNIHLNFNDTIINTIYLTKENNND